MNARLLTRRWVLSLCTAFCLHGAAAHAQQVSDAQVKAALIYNFMVFVEWPAEGQAKRAPLNVCLSPASDIHEPIQALREKLVRGHVIAVRAFREMHDAANCQVLYIDHSLRAQWPSIRKRAAGKSLLTIADPDVLDIEGVVINLVTLNSRIGFEVDSIAARDANLLISSKLLRLARKVH